MSASETTTITLSGPLDAAAAASVRKRFHDAWRTAKGSMVVDIGGVTFIDSAGVGTIVSLLKHLTRHGASLRIVGADGQPKRMLTLVGLSALVQADVVRDGAQG